MTELSVLDRAATLIAEKGWIQGQEHFLTTTGMCGLGKPPVIWHDERFCAIGAIKHAAKSRLEVQAALDWLGMSEDELIAFNDNPRRTREQVIGLLAGATRTTQSRTDNDSQEKPK